MEHRPFGCVVISIAAPVSLSTHAGISASSLLIKTLSCHTPPLTDYVIKERGMCTEKSACTYSSYNTKSSIKYITPQPIISLLLFVQFCKAQD